MNVKDFGLAVLNKILRLLLAIFECIVQNLCCQYLTLELLRNRHFSILKNIIIINEIDHAIQSFIIIVNLSPCFRSIFESLLSRSLWPISINSPDFLQLVLEASLYNHSRIVVLERFLHSYMFWKLQELLCLLLWVEILVLFMWNRRHFILTTWP